jgi:alanyl-tRNA synthetase
MKSSVLRQAFLDYFKAQGHAVVPSSSLVPANDPTLLFTNAGMVQFKELFLGKEQRAYTQAASSQRCVRAGGKHNDLENVGYTARHHTFFEMLGNFSFGDYFKRDAIRFAWTFLTEVLGLPPEKLWVTVFVDDDEAADIWLKEMKISSARFSRCGEKDNFWSMGDTGPCGPCSEIFYDHGPEIPGGPPGSPDEDADRYIEIWNLVFMQFNRTADGKMTLLPKPSVDTGMGLERIAAVMQGVHNNYDIDLFQQLIQAVDRLLPVDHADKPLSKRVIADHIRAICFLIVDGVVPSNEGRGYVLRRIIRRAVRHGHKLGLREPFLHQLVMALVEEMGEAYPELTKSRAFVEKILLREEKQFAMTLEQGIKLFDQVCDALEGTSIPGKALFKLYDTYGFPIDLTADIARERGLTLDYDGFEQEMSRQRRQSQAASQFAVDYGASSLDIQGQTVFTGYEKMHDSAEVLALVSKNQLVNRLGEGEEGTVVLNQTPFYAEAGGQIGDKGELSFDGGVFVVMDTQKQGAVYLHKGKLMSGELTVGKKVNADVHASRRAIARNHSATHLLHAALRHLLGDHIKQKGSLVEANRLRFDFAHFAPLTAEEIKAVERLVNQQIQANLPSHTEMMTPEEAKQSGAMALFDEKYGDQVRVLSMGEFSVELCGGTHVSHTGDIGLFKITTETGIAAGVRRIEALTGDSALDYFEQQEALLQTLSGLLKTNWQDAPEKLTQLIEKNKAQEKILSMLASDSLKSKTAQLIADAVRVGEYTLVQGTLEISPDQKNALRDMVDNIKQQVPRAIVILAGVLDDSVHLTAGVSKDAVSHVKAGELVGFLAQQIGGKGGGRPDMAQGGGTQKDKLPAAMASVRQFIIDSD